MRNAFEWEIESKRDKGTHRQTKKAKRSESAQRSSPITRRRPRTLATRSDPLHSRTSDAHRQLEHIRPTPTELTAVSRHIRTAARCPLPPPSLCRRSRPLLPAAMDSSSSSLSPSSSTPRRKEAELAAVDHAWRASALVPLLLKAPPQNFVSAHFERPTKKKGAAAEAATIGDTVSGKRAAGWQIGWRRQIRDGRR